MLVKLHTGKSIIIKDEYVDRAESETRCSDTSYINEFTRPNLDADFKLRVRSYLNIHLKIQGNYTSYLDLLGGVGLTGRIFTEDPKHSFYNDLDVDCVRVLKDNYFTGNVFSQDMFKFNFNRKFDLVVGDFNDLTISKYKSFYKPVVDKVFKTSTKYVVLNECSIFYLKFGANSYKNYSKTLGETITTRPEYFKALKRFYEAGRKGWKLVHIEFFTNSTILLFEKSNSNKFTQHYNSTNNNSVKVIR